MPKDTKQGEKKHGEKDVAQEEAVLQLAFLPFINKTSHFLQHRTNKYHFQKILFKVQMQSKLAAKTCQDKQFCVKMHKHQIAEAKIKDWHQFALFVRKGRRSEGNALTHICIPVTKQNNKSFKLYSEHVSAQ